MEETINAVETIETPDVDVVDAECTELSPLAAICMFVLIPTGIGLAMGASTALGFKLVDNWDEYKLAWHEKQAQRKLKKDARKAMRLQKKEEKKAAKEKSKEAE